MLAPETIKKMNQLKTVLDANPEFVESLKNRLPESGEHPLIEFAQQNDITISVEELDVFFNATNGENRELDDDMLGNVAGGGFLDIKMVDGKTVCYWRHQPNFVSAAVKLKF